MAELTLARIIDALRNAEAKGAIEVFEISGGFAGKVAAVLEAHASMRRGIVGRPISARIASGERPMTDLESRYCNCYDPWNCKEQPPGRICRAWTARERENAERADMLQSKLGECDTELAQASELLRIAEDRIAEQASRLGERNKLLQAIHNDLWIRASLHSSGERVVDISNSVWRRLCDAVDEAFPIGAVEPAPVVETNPCEHPEATCEVCGGPNVVWFAANELWNKVMGGPDGVVCPVCFVHRAESLGLNGAAWELRQEVSDDALVVESPLVPCACELRMVKPGAECDDCRRERKAPVVETLKP